MTPYCTLSKSRSRSIQRLKGPTLPRLYKSTIYNIKHRVEFSKPNIEIAIMVTKASKLRSVIYSHNFHHFHHYVPHHSHYFPQQYFFFIFGNFFTVKRVQKSKKRKNVKITRKMMKIYAYITDRSFEAFVTVIEISIFSFENSPLIHMSSC